MKIALIIFPIHPSHGCILQTFALQQVLLKDGHEVTIIDRQWDKPGIFSRCKDVLKFITGKISGKQIFLRSKTQDILMSELMTFVNRNIDNRIVYKSNPQYSGLKEFDAFIVGSDQTWRPKYVSDVTYYYLEFVPKEANVKRIAYAPSFGTDEWEYSPKLTAYCKELIQRFDAVSVREESGVKLCNEMYNVEATHVVDPTMLLEKDDYIKATNTNFQYDNIASYYLLDSSQEKLSIVKAVCDSLGLKPHRVNTETENSNAPVNLRIAPSIEKWIDGFARSKFIIADSFHATVFAILFNKPFITIANTGRGLSRFESILGKLGLRNRLIFKADDLTENLITGSVDWELVNSCLRQERSRSLKFLIENLK